MFHVQLACRKGFIIHWSLRGQSNISSTPCPRSFSNSTAISFFIPPINTVFYLIEQLIQYFVLLNDCDKEQKKESLCRGYSICMSSMASSILHIHFHSPDIMFLGTTPANQPDSLEYMPRGGGVGRASSWPIRWAYMTKLLPSYRRRVWWCCVSAHCGQTSKDCPTHVNTRCTFLK